MSIGRLDMAMLRLDRVLEGLLPSGSAVQHRPVTAPVMTTEPLDRKRLAERHLPLVKSLAGKMRDQLPGHLELQDLVGYGSKGLMEAAERYDPSRGIAFSTFAHYRIRGAMLDGMRRMGGLSRAVVSRYNASALADDYLEGAQQRDAAADPSERSRASTADTLRGLSEHVGTLASICLVSLDAERLSEGSDERAQDALDRVNYTWLAPRVKAALAELSDKERQLLEDSFYGGLTIKEAGEKLGLSKSWASRMHARAIRRLGVLLGAAGESV